MTFTQFIEQAQADGAAGFWGYVRAQQDRKPVIDDLASVTPETVKSLAQTSRYTAVDLEAGYRALCVMGDVEPAWPPRVYP